MNADRIKQGFLYALVISVIASALLGVLAILSERMGPTQIKVLLTTATVSLMSLFGLACGAYLATGRETLLPRAGIGLALVGGLATIVGIWLELESEPFWKATLSASVFAVACGHLSLLSMARLAEWFQWSLKLAHVVILGVATLIVVMMLADVDSDGAFRLLAVAAIIDGAITILIPIFHRLSRGAPPAPADGTVEDPIDVEIAQLRARIAELEARRGER